MKVTEKGKMILTFLAGEEPNTFLLGKEISEGLFHLNPKQVTGALTALGRNGLVDKTDDSPRKYSISENGRTLVEDGFPEGEEKD